MFCLPWFPLAVISLTGAENVTEVATLAWGQALGSWALYAANLFAICAMMSSYWAVGGSMLTNIVDMFKFKNEHDTKTRLIAIACVGLPPFILAYSGLIGFVDAIYLAGTFGGVIMSILPALMVNSARKNGDMEPIGNVDGTPPRACRRLLSFCSAPRLAMPSSICWASCPLHGKRRYLKGD